jgi:hypothetical protein
MVSIAFERFGELKIDDKIYYSDMIVWWDGEREFVEKDHVLDMKLFTKLLRKKPDVMVIGTGQQGRVRIPDGIRELAKARNVRLFEEISEKAVEIFNAMVATGRKTVAFVHTTS